MSVNFVLFLLLLPQQKTSDLQEAKARTLFQAMQTKYDAAKTLTITTSYNVYSEKNGKKHLTESSQQQLEAWHPSLFRSETVSKTLDKELPDSRFVFNPPPGVTEKAVPDLPLK